MYFNSLTGNFIMIYGAMNFNDESKISYYMVLSTKTNVNVKFNDSFI